MDQESTKQLKGIDMGMEEGYVIDGKAVLRDVERILDLMKELCGDSFIRKVMEKDQREELLRWSEQIREKMDDRFLLVVVGDFKRGKSMLVNAILGKKVATTNVKPETVTINRVSWGEEEKLEAVLENGRKFSLKPEDLNRDALEELLGRLPAPVKNLEIREPCEILKELDIVDTPGLGDIMGRFDDKVTDYLGRADAVLYVTSCLAPVSDSEKTFLSSVLAPDDTLRLLVLVNLCDCLDSQEDIRRIRENVQEKIYTVTENAGVFPVSGLDELCRKTGKQRPNEELAPELEAGFQDFMTMVESDILLRKEAIRSGRLLSGCRQMLSAAGEKIRLLGSLLGRSQAELEQMEEKCRQEQIDLVRVMSEMSGRLKELADQLLTEARAWMEDFLKKLKQEVQGLYQAPLVDLEKHMQFFLSDKIKEAAALCTKKHQEVMNREIRKLLSEQRELLLPDGLSEQKLDRHIGLPDISWTGMDTAAFAIDMGLRQLNMEGLMSVVYIVAGFLRQSKKKTQQKDLLEPLLDKFPALELEVMEMLGKAYDAVRQEAERLLEESIRSQADSSQEAVKQARQVAEAESIREDQVKENLAGAEELLDQAYSILKKYGETEVSSQE